VSQVKTVLLDNEAVQALADPGHRKHRQVIAIVEALAARNLRRVGSVRLVVPVVDTPIGGWAGGVGGGGGREGGPEGGAEPMVGPRVHGGDGSAEPDHLAPVAGLRLEEHRIHLDSRRDARRLRLHDLRHTHASLGLAAGIPVKVMSERLGHTSSSFTADAYQHVTPALEEQAAATVARLVFGP